MNRTLKIILKTVAGIVVLAIVLVVGGVVLVNSKAFQQRVLQQAQNAPAEVRTISDKTTYDKLPKEFTYDDLKTAKGPGYSDSTYRSDVKRWRDNGFIKEQGDGRNKIFIKIVA